MGWEIFWTFFLVFANGFFVAAEFAIVKVRASQIEIKIKTGSRVAHVAKHITNHLDDYLAATQLGITISSLALGWIGGAVMTGIVTNAFGWFNIAIAVPMAKGIGLVAAFAIIIVLHIVLGELVPKSVATQRPVGTTMAIALPLRFFYVLFKPIIWGLNGLANLLLKLVGLQMKVGEAHHSSEELQYLLDQGRESGTLGIVEHELIKNVFDFNERIVKNIMVPRTKISAIEMNCSGPEVIERITKEGYSRIPIYDDDIDQIIGIVHTKDILPILARGKELVLRSIIRKPYFVPETKKINDLMAELQQKRMQIAIVLDEFGGTAGMVTLEDIVEELVGEIQDEYDEETPIVEKISDTEYMVDASANVHDINEFLPRELPESSGYDTISGLVSDLFDKIPDVGERMEFHGYNFIVMKKTQQNIEFVKLELIAVSDEDDGE